MKEKNSKPMINVILKIMTQNIISYYSSHEYQKDEAKIFANYYQNHQF